MFRAGKHILQSLILLTISSMVMAGYPTVKDARLWAAPDNTRVVFDISAPVEHNLFTLSKPNRIVIDIKQARLVKGLNGAQYNKGVVRKIRTGKHNKTDLRIVLDLNQAVKPKSFLLKPHQQYGHRLVLDLEKQSDSKPRAVKSVEATARSQQRDLIIAIDAGHGGEDPGASGYRGTKEKVVVMQIAKRLERLIRQEYGMQPLMIRTGDYYIGLKKRVKIARENKADMFISIHADAFHDKRARGASIYALSRHGASTETARWLAASENASDFIGGVSLDDKDELLTSVLLDLSMNSKVEESLELGNFMLSELKKVSRVHKSRVGQAGFAVLKSPDIPSVLVETAFISNPQEEKKLRDPRHQQYLARSILKGVRTYFAHNTVPGTLLAQRQRQRRHVISEGENLSVIANRYQVDVQTLRSANSLESDLLRVGDVLMIPGG